ncbi:ABC transporter substrate-binding protein [Sulfurimonas sp.]|uniref:ABC transporter substrate-binding protein n=1 Tax=Sulfurimonas sp. TaxID=2022749 RepID=UPI002AB1F094|nr:ABC transporter substrate-binding protein [Sulfurimonas sp.]
MKYFTLLLIVFLSLSAAQKPLDKVSLQLVWLDQFQFAGYYMAKEKGYYKDVGLDVEIKRFKYSMNTIEEVLSSRATYGVGRSSLIRERSRGKEIVLLSAIFQSSPFTLLALESSNIKGIKDFVGKKLMLIKNVVETASIHAMILSNGVSESDMTFKEHNFDLEEFIDGKIDLYAGYISNEPYILEKRGIAYKIFSPKKVGFDFYSDILFTSEKEAQRNPLRVDAFKEASLKGWRYAFEHIDEAVKIIYEKYNTQNKTLDALKFEAKELKKLAYANEQELGTITQKKIIRIFDVYKIMGLTKYELDVSTFIFDNHSIFLTAKEKEYLKNKKEIRVCVPPDYLPYSGVVDGKFIGIGSGILNIAKKSLGVSFKLVKTGTWQQSLEKSKKGECDLLPIVEPTPSRRKYLNFTTSYHHDPLVVVTNNSQNYILDIQTVLDKEFVVVEGNSYVENLLLKYPKIKLNLVSSRAEAYKGVESGEYYGFIDVMMVAAYYMQEYSKLDLKISGRFDDSVTSSFGVIKEDKILFSIFEKVALSLEARDIQKILKEWVSINYTTQKEYEGVKKLLIFIFIAGAIFLYRQYLLKKKNFELEELQNKLSELNASLETKVENTVQEIVKKDAYMLHQSRLAQMGEMLSMIAHQWKQPLGAISSTQIALKMTLELEKYDLDDKIQREEFIKFLDKKLDKIGAYTQNLSQIISDFSDYYKSDKKSKILNVDAAIVKACRLIEDNLVNCAIDVTLSLDAKSFVKLYENEFMQVVLNILNNAREQLEQNNIQDKKIKVKSYEENDFFTLEISDNAGGIDESIISKVFDPYFSTKMEKNGTGLGLYMSKKIIQEHLDGSIDVKNSENGAVFTIKIKIEEKENIDTV